jgi:hypothetical protein
MKRGVTVYSRMQARTKMIIDMLTAGTDPTKPTIFALGRNYKGTRARLQVDDRWTPVCKAVLDVLLKRHFMVVLIDEYLTPQMCQQLSRQAEPSDGRTS